MKNHRHSETLEKKVKKFAKGIANRMDVAQYQEFLFWLLSIRCASEYRDMDNGLSVPNESKWSFLKSKIDSPSFGEVIDNSLKEFERINSSLNGLLPSFTGKALFSATILKPIFEFIDSLSLDFFHSMDLFGRIYEYLHSGTGNRKNGIFFTPDCVALLLAEMLQADSRIIYDPCCGTGTMFVHVINYINMHSGDLKEVAIYGQESNPTLYCLCRMNLALRGVDNSNIHWTSDGSLLKDACSGLKADFVLANPPFNDTNWGWEKFKEDPQRQYGSSLPRNANFIWLLHAVCHLSAGGRAGVLLPNGSLSTSNPAESRIRQRMVEAGIVECVMGLPDRLFLNTSIPACLWILSVNE
jgi:type I restriction enzyme M protein